MKQLRNKEEALVLLLTNEFRLNKYDKNFLSNLSILLAKNRHITTNQDILFTKLLEKYKRQLKKMKVDHSELLLLKWHTKVIESSTEFTEAHLSVHDGRIMLRVPFNKKLIEKLREFDSHNYLQWNSIDKCYYSDYYTHVIKNILNVIPNYYKLNISQDIINELNQLLDYEDIQYWNPTLVKIKDHYYIIACNEPLVEAIKHIELNNDPKTLCEISRYGINIDKSITQGNKFLEFASNYDSIIDVSELDTLHQYCKLLDIKNIICNYRIKRTKDMKNYFDKILGSNGLNVYYDVIDNPRKEYHGKSIYLYYFSTAVVEHPNYVTKKVRITNSNPIKI
jgi:hypothetical protein